MDAQTWLLCGQVYHSLFFLTTRTTTTNLYSRSGTKIINTQSIIQHSYSQFCNLFVNKIMRIRSRSEEHTECAAASDAESDDTNREFPDTGSDDDDEEGMGAESDRIENGDGDADGHGKHRRSMTEPMDGQKEEIGSATTVASSASGNIDYCLPTLSRFPLAQSQNKSCWSQPEIDIFRVRGANYLASKKKVKIPSENFLLEARGLDFFVLSETHPIDSLAEHTSKILGGTLRMKPTLILNFKFPWGLLIQYYEIPQKLAPLLQNYNYSNCSKNEKKDDTEPEENVEITKALESFNFDTPAERLFAKWLISDNDYKNKKLKLIPHVAEGPWAVRKAVKGTPALIGMKLPIKYYMEPATCTTDPYDGKNNLAPYLLCELDIGNSSKAAKKIVGVCRRYMASLTLDIGFVIEGSHEKELPEQMLGCVRVHQVDTNRSVALF